MNIRSVIEDIFNRIGICVGKLLFFPTQIFNILYDAYISGFYSSQILPPPIDVKIGKNIFLRGGKYIRIGQNSSIGKNVILTAWDHFRDIQSFNPKIIFGEHCMIGDYNNISAIHKILFGNNVLTGRFVTIIDHSHGDNSPNTLSIPPWDRHLYSKGEIKIGNNVWIGDKVTILSGISVGDNCVIGANSVVTKSFPSNCIIGGNPAKIIKKYAEDL